MSHIKPWQEVNRVRLFYEYGRGVDKVIYRLPDGSDADFYIKNEKSGVAVLALTENQDVILVRQYRPGPQRIIDDMPGGFIDEGETAAQTAARELKEETGYVGQVIEVGALHDDAYSSRLKSICLALDCKLVSQPIQTPSEQLEVVLVPLKNFRARLRKGQFIDTALAYMALDYLELL